MTTRYISSYIDYSENLVDECNNTYHRSKKPIYADYSTLTEGRIIKLLNLKLVIEQGL